MEIGLLREAADLVGRANELVERAGRRGGEGSPPGAMRRLVAAYGTLVKLGSAGGASAARLLGDPGTLARATGTSMGKAREAIKTARQAERTPALAEALRAGELSLDQATEITKTESAVPGSTGRLLGRVRGGAPFHVLRENARRLRLEAQDPQNLARQQHEARYLRHGVTDMGTIRFEAELEPHVGMPLLSRLQAEAKRLSRKAKAAEPFERYLADALPALLDRKGPGKGRTEMVVLVSHGVAERGWNDVRDEEFCKIPGVGPISPETAKRIAGNAFLTGLFYDGRDLRHIRRWGGRIPAEIRIALNLGDPPEFEGRRCVDCGNRYFLETDHDEPRAAGGETALDNLRDRCDSCHDKKTARDREAGLLRPQRPPALAHAPP